MSIMLDHMPSRPDSRIFRNICLIPHNFLTQNLGLCPIACRLHVIRRPVLHTLLPGFVRKTSTWRDPFVPARAPIGGLTIVGSSSLRLMTPLLLCNKHRVRVNSSKHLNRFQGLFSFCQFGILIGPWHLQGAKMPCGRRTLTRPAQHDGQGLTARHEATQARCKARCLTRVPQCSGMVFRITIFFKQHLFTT